MERPEVDEKEKKYQLTGVPSKMSGEGYGRGNTGTTRKGGGSPYGVSGRRNTAIKFKGKPPLL